ncbi:MAG: ankyrin repeat domain-containing protein [Polyangiaceae bacterium]
MGSVVAVVAVGSTAVAAGAIGAVLEGAGATAVGAALVTASGSGSPAVVDGLAFRFMNAIMAIYPPEPFAFLVVDTALMAAAAAGADQALIDRLVAWGATVDDADEWGFEAIHVAAQFGHLDALVALVAHGANPAQRPTP